MVQPGHITDMGSTLDLLPTFCELTGTELPSDRIFDGTSLLNVIKDNRSHSKRETFFYYRGSKLFAVRKGKYKLHFMDKSAYGRDHMRVLEKPVLFEIGSDPGEHYNLADKYPEIVIELTEMANKHKASTPIAESIFDKK